MKLIYTNPILPSVQQLQVWLESCGIHSELRNEHLAALRGITGITELWPELYVNDAEYEDAQQAFAKWRQQTEAVGGESWVCSKCKEVIEPQFTECWNCGSARPKTGE